MSRLCLPRYTVIRDTREQKDRGWIFDKHKPERRPPNCDGTVRETLHIGDYSLVGYQDILTIERKAHFSELWTDYSPDRKKMDGKIERMSEIKHKYILIESSIEKDHFQLSPPQYRTNVPGKALIRWLMAWSVKHNIHVMFVGQCGKSMAQMIFEQVVREEKDRWILSG